MIKRLSAPAVGMMLVALIGFASGCSDQQSQTVEKTTTTTSQPSDSAENNTNASEQNPDATTSTTSTTTTTTPEDQHESVLGATTNAAWTIVTAPFRLVGDAFEILF
jgi:hypothetical protein